MSKALFFDIDGTLLDHANGINEIPSSVKKEMKRLQDDNNYLFIASGRPYAFLSKEIKEAGFDGYVLCNGAHVLFHDEIIYHRTLEHEKVDRLINYLEMNNWEYVIETENYSYLNPKYTVLDEFFKECHIDENYMVYEFDKEKIKRKALKIEVNSKDDEVPALVDFIANDFDYDSHGTANSLEIYSNYINKASGIKSVCDYLNISMDDTYAFGDGTNDIEMLTEAHHGIAMGNALEEVKEAANEVCDSIKNDGLAKYLQTIK
ncbi:MAG: HAD family hydrolase [Thomasclavelia sp.]|nr:HAD family hydrolase [Thomasclavelia sp.]